MTNTQELPITPENIANLKVGDEVLIGLAEEKASWLEVTTIDKGAINGWIYFIIRNGVCMFNGTKPHPLDLHAIRKAVAIPEGWTKYDPAVLPPENAAMLEMSYEDGGKKLHTRDWFVLTWSTYNNSSYEEPRTMYRVTKWKTKSAAQKLAACLCGEYTEEALVEKLEAFAKEIRG